MKIVIGILSYNMPELSDSLYNQLKKIVRIPVEYIVYDNGSDLDKIAKCTTHRIDHNTRLTGGMNEILKITKEKKADYCWLCTNDIQFQYNTDPIQSMISKCESDKSIGIIHPSLIEPVHNYAYQWMIKIPNEPNRKGYTKGHKMVDIIAPLYTRKALEYNNWQFDSRFLYWGQDWDSSYIARKAGLQIAVDFDILLSHKTSAVYDAGNDKEFKNRQEYYKKAIESMKQVFTDKYGPEWRKIIGAN